jgi:hypothetical protein
VVVADVEVNAVRVLIFPEAEDVSKAVDDEDKAEKGLSSSSSSYMQQISLVVLVSLSSSTVSSFSAILLCVSSFQLPVDKANFLRRDICEVGAEVLEDER